MEFNLVHCWVDLLRAHENSGACASETYSTSIQDLGKVFGGKVGYADRLGEPFVLKLLHYAPSCWQVVAHPWSMNLVQLAPVPVSRVILRETSRHSLIEAVVCQQQYRSQAVTVPSSGSTTNSSEDQIHLVHLTHPHPVSRSRTWS
jgi:hypothetical protein